MKKSLLILLLVIIVLGGVLGGAYYIYDSSINIDTIYSGVKIDGYEVGNRRPEDAINFISLQKQTDDMDKTISLSYLDKNYDISLSELGYTYDFEKAVDEAYSLGREGNPIERYRFIKELKKGQGNIVLEPKYDMDLVLKLVDKIEEDLYQEAKDASLEFNSGSFVVSKAMPGITLKKSDLINQIVDSINNPGNIQIPVDIVEPKITEDLLGRVNGIIGQFSTSFKGSSSGRIQNIRQSAKAVSNLLVLPGEEFSFNELVGPIGPSTGYTEAPVIVNGELTPGLGGGVCQSSTTLYNALLLSDVKIVERHPHSIAAAYVPRGTDGAVARGYLDLKFMNNFDFPIYIHSSISGNTIQFYVYGDKNSKDYSVKIEPELLQTIPYKVQEIYDATLEPGARVLQQEGRTGYKVRTFKSIIKDGIVIERTQINYDYYRERDYIYKVGPQLPETVESDGPTLETISQPIEPVESQPVDEDIEVIDLLP